MELSIINIGNSKGIRFSKAVLEQYNISDKVELILEKNQIIIRPKIESRKNWDKVFMQMHQNGDDQLLINDVFEEDTFE